MGIQEELDRIEQGKAKLVESLSITNDILLYTSEDKEDIVDIVDNMIIEKDDYYKKLEYCAEVVEGTLNGIAAISALNIQIEEEQGGEE